MTRSLLIGLTCWTCLFASFGLSQSSILQLAGKSAIGSLGVERGGTKLTARFQGDGTVILRTAEEGIDIRGTWSQSGNTVTMKAGSSSFSGTITGNHIAGHRSRRQGAVYVPTEDSWYLDVEVSVVRDSSPQSGARITYNENAPKRLASAASELAKDPKYKASNEVTNCSEFVRDVAKQAGSELPELEGRAGDQFDKLWQASKELQSKWVALSPDKDVAAAFRSAQDAANLGKPTVVCWKNPNPSSTNSGHCAIVVPIRGSDQMQQSRTWKAQVPYIAQAGAPISALNGESVFDYLPLSWGFGTDKKDGMKIFIREKP